MKGMVLTVAATLTASSVVGAFSATAQAAQRQQHVSAGPGLTLPAPGRAPHDPAKPLLVKPSHKKPLRTDDTGVTGSAPLTYKNGPVMTSTVNYAIFWEPSQLQNGQLGGVVDSYNYDLSEFFLNVGGSQLYNVATQYYQATNGTLQYVTNNSQWGDYYIDTSPYPPSNCTDTATPGNCLTDAQIQQEVQKAMQLKGWSGGGTHMFFVYTDKGEGSTSAANGSAYNDYCGYHYWFVNSATNEGVIYANMPYSGTVPAGKNYAPCAQIPHTPENNVDADAEISVTSHELLEAVTDWDAVTGWRNPTSPYGEIGDQCANIFGGVFPFDNGLANQSMNGWFFTTQEEWSNIGNQCLQGSRNLTAPTVSAPTVRFTQGAVVSSTSIPVTVSWSATDADGIQKYYVNYRVDSGSWQTLCACSATSATLATANGHSYDVEVAAVDNAGNSDAVFVHKTFVVNLYDNGSSLEQSGGGWTQNPAPSAIGGNYLSSSVLGAYRSFAFTGTDAAWVALKSWNLGQAKPWYDTTWDTAVDLYSSTLLPSQIVYSHHFDQAGPHTIGFQVVGTISRPLVDEDAFVVIH